MRRFRRSYSRREMPPRAAEIRCGGAECGGSPGERDRVSAALVRDVAAKRASVRVEEDEHDAGNALPCRAVANDAAEHLRADLGAAHSASSASDASVREASGSRIVPCLQSNRRKAPSSNCCNRRAAADPTPVGAIADGHLREVREGGPTSSSERLSDGRHTPTALAPRDPRRRPRRSPGPGCDRSA